MLSIGAVCVPSAAKRSEDVLIHLELWSSGRAQGRVIFEFGALRAWGLGARQGLGLGIRVLELRA